MKKNMGKIDRILRAILAVALLAAGLFWLEGLSGDLTGIIVATLSLIPIFTSSTAFCPIFSMLKIHSFSKKECETHGDPYEK